MNEHRKFAIALLSGAWDKMTDYRIAECHQQVSEMGMTSETELSAAIDSVTNLIRWAHIVQLGHYTIADVIDTGSVLALTRSEN